MRQVGGFVGTVPPPGVQRDPATGRVRLTNSGDHFEAPLGTAAAPGIAFLGDSNVGFYRPAADEIGVVCGGGRILTFTGYNVVSGEANALIRSDVAAGANPPFLFRATADFSAGQAVFFVQDNAGSGMSFQIMGDGSLVAKAGSVGAPTYSTLNDQDTGMYFPAADSVGISVGNTLGLQVSLVTAALRLGVFGATPAVKQASGADLTNNVTAGGTDDTIANFTDLTTFANSAAAIRNDIYQLARKLKQVNDALRVYGWLT